MKADEIHRSASSPLKWGWEYLIFTKGKNDGLSDFIPTKKKEGRGEPQGAVGADRIIPAVQLAVRLIITCELEIQ